jgi:hypothetical protein
LSGSRRFGRNVGGELRGIDLCQKPGARGVPQVAGVDRQEQVGRATLAFGLEPLEHLAGAAREHLDLDTGLLGERLEGRLLTIVTSGIDEDLVADAVVAAARPRSSANRVSVAARRRRRLRSGPMGAPFGDARVRIPNLKKVCHDNLDVNYP